MESSYDAMMAAKGFLPFRMGYLTDWMVKKAEEELNETEENRSQALAELRRLISNEKNLDIWTDDFYLLQFLRVRKFDPQRAMDVIRNLYTAFQKFPEIFPKSLDTGLTKSLFDTNSAGPLPYRHKDGGVVLLFKASNWNPDQHPAELTSMAMTAIALFVAEDPATQVCGVHLIYDAKFELKHLRAMTPRLIKLFSTLLNFHFHGSDMKELHKYIPKEILPPEYGGDNINYSASESCETEFLPLVGRLREMLSKGYSC